MVGDRLDTDIVFGQTGGVATLLVMTGEFTPAYLPQSRLPPPTGVSKEEDLTGPNRQLITPTYITASLGDLRKATMEDLEADVPV